MLNQLAKILSVIVLLSVMVYAQEQPETRKQENIKVWNTVCPVDGNPVNLDIVTIKHSGKLYGFCSATCSTVFGEEPESYAANLSEDGTKFVKNQEVRQSDEK